MLKTISAALLAVSVIAAPALAATSGKSAVSPTTKTTQAPVMKAGQTKTKVLNANAQMGHQYKHVRHHRYHKHIGVLKTHAAPKLAVKPVAPAKRG
jgi:hypothetical protein